MNPEHFKIYTADDFILDDDFRKIVRKSGSNGRLKALLENLPEKKIEINLAVQILRELRTEKFKQTDNRKQELWLQILQKQRRKARLFYFRYAASFLLLAGIGSSVFYLSNRKPQEEAVVSDIIPARDAMLVLSNGKTVSISSKQSTVQYSPDGSGIMVNDTSGIAQSVSDGGLNQLIVPFGKRSYIVLSEGTKVWLNSGSKLVFPPVFKGKTREVVLEGEALFEVSGNKEKPFYVKTDAFRLKVYGTKFNVQAYLQDNAYQIVLVKGKVSMSAKKNLQAKEVFLAPNQKATLSKGEEKFEISAVENTEIYTAWIDGYLTFTNEEISSVLRKVSRYYNVNIDTTELPKNMEKIYGKLDLKEDLKRVLDGIAFISRTKYEKRGDKYVFIMD